MTAIRRVAAIILAIATSVAAGGCGSSSHAGHAAPANTVPSRGPHTLTVSPSRPTPHATVAFGFRAPAASGVHGRQVIAYSLSVTGAARGGCIGAHEAATPTVGAGRTATVSVGPAQLGGPWCPGPYAARVIELERPHCTGRAPCPQYIRVVAIVARSTFTVAQG